MYALAYISEIQRRALNFLSHVGLFCNTLHRYQEASMKSLYNIRLSILP